MTSVQNNTDGSGELRERVYSTIYHGLTMAEADYYTDWFMKLLAAEQEKLLERLLAQKLPASFSGGKFNTDGVTAFTIEAELQRVREGKS